MSDEIQPTKKSWVGRHKILTAVIVFLLIGAIGAAGGDKSKNSTTTKNEAASTKQDKKKPEAAKLNTAVRDGKFEFVVKSLQCGQESVGTDQYFTKKAQGQFCSVTVSVTNIGDKPQSLFSTNQKGFNSTGQQYTVDDTATMYATSNNASWYSEINPGNTVMGPFVFDIPKDATLKTIELHDSAISGGVKVSLE